MAGYKTAMKNGHKFPVSDGIFILEPKAHLIDDSGSFNERL
jgi:hypothetical protein